MTPGRKGEGGKIISLDAFRKKGEITETQPVVPQQPAQESVAENASPPAQHTKDKKECVCVFCDLEKQGIPAAKAAERREQLESLKAQGIFNPRQFQQWLDDLRQEDLGDLSNRVLGLDEQKTQTHPTYARAVFQIFREKLQAKIATYIPPEKE